MLGLGTHGVGETVSFQVPPGTGSVTIVQQGTQPSAAQTVTYQGEVLGNTVVPWTVKVGGTEFYNDGAVAPADPATVPTSAPAASCAPCATPGATTRWP